jgi:FAD:protein FMN transferase
MWFRKEPLQGKPWDEHFELAVNFEINLPEGRRILRPYVAVWIEDKDGYSVRTLTLWFQLGRGVRWLNSLRRWLQKERQRQLADSGDLSNTVSSATRPAGKYQVVWNGHDDKNKPVAQGTYTLYIEAAREHGTYQLIRKELTLGSQPLKGDLEGNLEIKSASFEYRRKK